MSLHTRHGAWRPRYPPAGAPGSELAQTGFGSEDLQRQSPSGVLLVEHGLGDEAHLDVTRAPVIQLGDQILQGPGEPVRGVDDDRVAGSGEAIHLQELWTFHIFTGGLVDVERV